MDFWIYVDLSLGECGDRQEELSCILWQLGVVPPTQAEITLTILSGRTFYHAEQFYLKPTMTLASGQYHCDSLVHTDDHGKMMAILARVLRLYDSWMYSGFWLMSS